jgi:hypothetical protein
VHLLMPMAGNATGAMAQIQDQLVGDKFVATSYNTLTATPAEARKGGEADVKRSAFMNTTPRADGKLVAEKSASTTSPPLEIFLASNAASADTVGGSLARLATCILLSSLLFCFPGMQYLLHEVMNRCESGPAHSSRFKACYCLLGCIMTASNVDKTRIPQIEDFLIPENEDQGALLPTVDAYVARWNTMVPDKTVSIDQVMTILHFVFGNHMVPASASPRHISEPRNPGNTFDSLKLQWLISSLTRHPSDVPKAMKLFNTYLAAAATAGAGPASGGETGEGGGGGGGKGAVGSKSEREEGAGGGKGGGVF